MDVALAWEKSNYSVKKWKGLTILFLNNQLIWIFTYVNPVKLIQEDLNWNFRLEECIGHTLKSWVQQILVPIMTLSPGFEKNYVSQDAWKTVMYIHLNFLLFLNTGDNIILV